MKIMNRILSVVAAAALAAGLLAGCGASSAAGSTASSAASSVAASSEAASSEAASAEASEAKVKAQFTVTGADGESQTFDLEVTDGEKLSDALAEAASSARTRPLQALSPPSTARPPTGTRTAPGGA